MPTAYFYSLLVSNTLAGCDAEHPHVMINGNPGIPSCKHSPINMGFLLFWNSCFGWMPKPMAVIADTIRYFPVYY
mgnify:CR=1 FL=1